MSNFISLDQYRALIQRNILVEPKMLVKNQTQPLGQITFQCAGDNFQMKDINVPASPNAFDLTQQAPLENLLASSQLKALIQSQRLVLLNPEDIPEPSTDTDAVTPVLSQTLVAGALSVDGTTSPNATVIVEQNGNVWTCTSNGAGVFTIDVSGLEEGQISITVTADGLKPSRNQYQVGPTPLQPMPEPTVLATFKDTTVTGSTVPNANIIVTFDTKAFTGQADGQGQFSVSVDPLPFEAITLTLEAAGYLTKQVQVNVASIQGIAVINPVAYLDASVSGQASPNASVEIEIDGQTSQLADADNDGLWSATVLPIQGAVHVRSLAVSGYAEATASVVPTKLQFGTITVDGSESFGENNTTVTGHIADLNTAAEDIAIVVTVQAGVYEGTVDLSTGAFTINGVDFKTGTNGTAVITVTSGFYEEGSTSFQILEEFAEPTLQQAVDGQTAVVGDTSASTSVKITMNGETKTASSNTQGAFSVGGFTNVVPGLITIELSKAGYITKQSAVTLAVQTVGELDHDLVVGDSTVTGMATPGATVTVTQGSITGDAVSDSQGDFSVTLSGPLVEGQAQLSVQKVGYVDFSDTLAVSPE